MSPDQQRTGGFVHTISKRALAPLIATATAFLIRKLTELWQEKVQPGLEERGGATKVARETIESVGEKLPDSVSDKLPDSVSEKLPSSESSSTGTDRDEERRKREQRRAQRRRTLDKARSS